MKPLVVDLFAGAGGMSLGFEQAGFDVAAAVEYNPIAAAVHKFNFPQTAVLCTSVVGLSGAEIRAKSNIGRDKVTCVIGGPPCQGFSLIGKRILDDPRNSLVLEFVRLVRELDADYFVFENVKGLTQGKHRGFLDELFGEFEQAGYSIKSPWQVLNAVNYGTPQNRERLILLGCKTGLRIPEYPEWTHRAINTPVGIWPELPTAPNVGDAFEGLPEIERYPALLHSDECQVDVFNPKGWYAREMAIVDDSAWHYGSPRKWDKSVLTSSIRTVHSKISMNRFSETRPGSVEPFSRFPRLALDGVSPTLRAGSDGSRGAFTSPRPIHPIYPRCITVREMARLHGMPDWFRLHKTKWHGAMEVGNAVAVPLARAIGQSIATATGYSPEVSKDVISLGNPNLLTLDGSAAALHFGIPYLTQRRDRKSGVKKRSQAETELVRQERKRM